MSNKAWNYDHVVSTMSDGLRSPESFNSAVGGARTRDHEPTFNSPVDSSSGSDGIWDVVFAIVIAIIAALFGSAGNGHQQAGAAESGRETSDTRVHTN